MKFYVFRTAVIRNLAVITDDAKKLPVTDFFKWQMLDEFDEHDATRKAWLRDDCLVRAKDHISKNGFVQLAVGAGIEEPG